ncbi:efflux RND transporter periplasmic adaptor subunit [Abyssalbus ytuae]|uniref:Efflux RND transporter periplasmic adaptor subunit n=1 Tax=Abyssalbus ytuae TaxID=2926907 RepID=A0A9E6ZVK6_9FLAO|nr:efflux RND transporter periplasmic adaptor subunit [Abyssalbus ytuae]UOB17596.1 efflux RND transporter periplasmic adaptor subunit [Abyssalbus ytuae]
MKTTIYSVLLFTGIFSLISCKGGEEKSQNDGVGVPVKVSTIEKENNMPFITASGKIEAVNSADLSTRMMGFVDKIYVNVGDKIKKGQLLISVNDADLTAKLAQVNAGITEAQAAYNIAQKDYERFLTLFKSNSASQKELDDITANYNMAKARLEAARQMKNEVNAQFSYANIRAPFNGVVTNKFINEGDMANPGMPLLEVESPGKFQVIAMVPESEISKVKPETEVTISIKSLNETVKGKVLEISTSSKNTGGQYLIKIIINETNTSLLSGMYATVQIPVEETTSTGTVLIPAEAIIQHGQLSGVYTVSQNNTALLRWLRLGRTYGDKVEVLSGLAADETFIISAESKLYNGAKISIQ